MQYGVRPMVLRGRPSKSYVFIDDKLFKHEADFRQWMGKALEFNKLLTKTRSASIRAQKRNQDDEPCH